MHSRIFAAFVLVAALIAACGGGSSDSGSTGPSAATATTGPTGGNGDTPASYTGVQPAVIQIVSQGTFRDPELGLSNGSGAGSGFIIGSDGLAVTNNHVVAGAATLEVYIGGDDSHSYNARIIGVSECNDLALIDINEDKPLTHLDWYQGDVTPGTDVYTAGFPLGDPEYTLTKGIVSKAHASGESDWSSLDYAIEHDATIQGGNSGGPLVTTDGKVLGINYASSEGTNSAIYYAVPGTIAQSVIEKLKDGNFESIGVNGWAVQDDELNLSGIWVAGVAAGSPASKAGLQAGDIITSLNGLPMGTDGTMADYCDVFRTNGADKPMTIEVYRYDSGETLRGEINGDKPIEVVSVLADIEEDTDIDTDGGGQTYSSYDSITDDTGTIVVNVPVEWTDVDTRPCDDNGVEIPCVNAATNIDGFYDNYTTSGMFFGLFKPTDIDGLLEEYAQSSACSLYGTYDYEDPIFKGAYDIWENCDGQGTYFVTLAAAPADNSYTVLVQMAIATDADWDALDEAFATFNVLQ
jgi:serine protease Do